MFPTLHNSLLGRDQGGTASFETYLNQNPQMKKCGSLVKNRDLDCSSIVTQEKAKLFRPDWEEGV